MKAIYEKPILRDLGQTIQNAQGSCRAGSVALSPGGKHCQPFGSVASKGNCTWGHKATKECTSGGSPK